MTRTILLTALILFGSLFSLKAQESFRYENTSFNVIRERMFNGTNSDIIIYKEDVRIKLNGATQEDSLLIKAISQELNSLMEVAKVHLVNFNANLEINFLPISSGIKNRNHQTRDGKSIKSTQIDICLDAIKSPDQQLHTLEYFIYKALVKTFVPQSRQTRYTGIFDSSDPSQFAVTHEIDKDIIRLLYSANFDQKLRANTIQQSGYFNYLKLGYSYQVNYGLTFLGIVIILGLIIFLISKSNIFSSKQSLKSYIINGYIVLFTYTLLQFFLGLSTDNPRTLISILTSTYRMLPIVLIYGTLIIVVLYFMEKYLIKSTDSFTKRQIIISFTTIFSILGSFVISSLCISLFLKLSGGKLAFAPQLAPNIILIMTAFILASFRVFFNYLNHRTQSLVNQKDVELSKMTALKNQAELQALQSRINPHFLYNALNSIAGLAESEPHKVQHMALSLSELFRYSVNKENATFVSIEEELKMVQQYLDVEQTRFGNKLDYKIELDETVKTTQIPKFMIQPLVENAIKHAASKMTETCKIVISIQPKSRNLELVVADNGPDFPIELVNGYGLQNLHDKLEILYGEKASINWENSPEKYIQITLKDIVK